MAKVLMTVELEYDADVMHGDDEESYAWFFDEILSEEKGLLVMHSNEIGDCIGKVRVLSATPSNAKVSGADKTGEVEQDLNKCPSCGGPADNGFSREIPPSPYYCTNCMEKLK